eukprot:jgi/Orpsp1_1/1188046/evm.model.d7180000062117.1
MTNDESILHFNGKENGDNPSFDILKNFDNSLEAKEIINNDEFNSALEAMDHVFSMIENSIIFMNKIALFNVMRRTLNNSVKDTSDEF